MVLLTPLFGDQFAYLQKDTYTVSRPPGIPLVDLVLPNDPTSLATQFVPIRSSLEATHNTRDPLKMGLPFVFFCKPI